MGSYGGHVVPGFFFAIFGLVFCACITLIDVSKSRQRRAIVPGSAGVFMAVLSLIGVLIELYWPGNAQGLLRDPVTCEFWSGNNWQHFTMYLNFLILGFMIVFVSRGPAFITGIIFLIFGFWITLRESLSYLSTRHSHRHFLRKDGIIILCAVALGSFVELFWPWNGNHPPFGRLRDPVDPALFFKPMNWQHFTMYLFFGIYGCTRLIEYAAPFLTGIDRLSAALAFFIEGFLFQNHVHGRSEIDKLIHILIVVICYASASFFLVSFFINCQRKRYLIDMVIGILVFAQGTWFVHVAEIIYGKNAWPGVLDTEEHGDHGKEAHGDMMEEGHDEEGHMGMDSSEHMNMMFAVIFFAWHVVWSIAINSAIAFTIYKILKRKEMIDLDFVSSNSSDLENNNAYQTGKGSSSNGGIHYESVNLSDKTPLLNGEDDDEETELFARA